jgi:hypothetical protein
LTIVSEAVAGGDLRTVAEAASDAIARPVVIAIPALGEPVVWPPRSVAADELKAIVEEAATVSRGDALRVPAAARSSARAAGVGPGAGRASAIGLDDAVAVRIGRDVVGIVAAAAGEGGDGDADRELRAWLDAAAAGAAVAALMREVRDGDVHSSRRALLKALGAGPTADIAALVGHARRLGFDLASGAIAICAQPPPGADPPAPAEVLAGHGALLADVGDGRVLGLVPLASALPAQDTAAALAAEFAAGGMEVATSAPRRDAASLHEALREAELLVELAASPDASLAAQEETYRLLIGVLLRDPDELEALRESTISAVVAYDSEHDTELVATLQAFLVHHGSTTETADAMSLHRHTVGYRLARVHEVSGLSPHESDGRERLSLGLKADQILAAAGRRTQHE